MIELIGYEASPYVRKVHVALHHKGLDFTLKPLDPFNDRDKILELNAAGKVPILIIDQTIIPDSNAICLDLEERYPETPKLMPMDTETLAKLDEFVTWVEDAVIRVFGSQLFFQRVIKPFTIEKQPNDSLVNKTLEVDGPELMAGIESFSPDAGFLLGDFGLADITFGASMRAGLLGGYDIPKLNYPKTRDYLRRIFTQPAFQKVIRHENKLAMIAFAKESFVNYDLIET